MRVVSPDPARFTVWRYVISCRWCGEDCPFEPTHCDVKFPTGRLIREESSLTISSINLSNCRKCYQRKPLPYVYENPNGHISLKICEDCAAILESLRG